MQEIAQIRDRCAKRPRSPASPRSRFLAGFWPLWRSPPAQSRARRGDSRTAAHAESAARPCESSLRGRALRGARGGYRSTTPSCGWPAMRTIAAACSMVFASRLSNRFRGSIRMLHARVGSQSQRPRTGSRQRARPPRLESARGNARKPRAPGRRESRRPRHAHGVARCPVAGPRARGSPRRPKQGLRRLEEAHRGRFQAELAQFGTEPV